MNVNQAIEALQKMVNTGVITGEEEIGAFTNMGETFLPIAEFKPFITNCNEGPTGEMPVVYPRFFTEII